MNEEEAWGLFEKLRKEASRGMEQRL